MFTLHQETRSVVRGDFANLESKKLAELLPLVRSTSLLLQAENVLKDRENMAS